jgi:outer membrane protein assembly factor BamB
MSRTVPVVTESVVVAMGPKCHVACLDAKTGELRWGLDLVKQFGTTIPQWYAGQCPIIEDGAVILAPGGKDALVMAVDVETGKVLWQTPNPREWKMTHASLAVAEFEGEKMYVYCASGGVVGVSAKDGRLLWETPEWKISIATVPSPVVLEEGRIFFSGGYNAGALMLQLSSSEGQFSTKILYKLDADTFGATQHSPIYYGKHLYNTRPDGQFACLNPDGKIAWASGRGQTFGSSGLGPFLIADGLIFVMNGDNGTLSLLEATPEGYNRLAQAQVLKGRESWGPMALAGTRLLARDLTRLVCLEVGAQ